MNFTTRKSRTPHNCKYVHKHPLWSNHKDSKIAQQLTMINDLVNYMLC